MLIDIYCAIHKKQLSVKPKVSLYHNDIEVEIYPCPECLKERNSEGYNIGYNDGYRTGLDSGELGDL